MKHNNSQNIDALLKSALRVDVEPDAEVIESIAAKNRPQVQKRAGYIVPLRIVSAAAVVVIAVLFTYFGLKNKAPVPAPIDDPTPLVAETTQPALPPTVSAPAVPVVNKFTVKSYAFEPLPSGDIILGKYELAKSNGQGIPMMSGFSDGITTYLNIDLRVEGENIVNVTYTAKNGYFAKQYVPDEALSRMSGFWNDKSYWDIRHAWLNPEGSSDFAPGEGLKFFESFKLMYFGEDVDLLGNSFTESPSEATKNELLFWAIENSEAIKFMPESRYLPDYYIHTEKQIADEYQPIVLYITVEFEDGETQTAPIIIDFNKLANFSIMIERFDLIHDFVGITEEESPELFAIKELVNNQLHQLIDPDGYLEKSEIRHIIYTSPEDSSNEIDWVDNEVKIRVEAAVYHKDEYLTTPLYWDYHCITYTDVDGKRIDPFIIYGNDKIYRVLDIQAIVTKTDNGYVLSLVELSDEVLNYLYG